MSQQKKKKIMKINKDLFQHHKHIIISSSHFPAGSGSKGVSHRNTNLSFLSPAAITIKPQYIFFWEVQRIPGFRLFISGFQRKRHGSFCLTRKPALPVKAQWYCTHFIYPLLSAVTGKKNTSTFLFLVFSQCYHYAKCSYSHNLDPFLSFNKVLPALLASGISSRVRGHICAQLKM